MPGSYTDLKVLSSILTEFNLKTVESEDITIHPQYDRTRFNMTNEELIRIYRSGGLKETTIRGMTDTITRNATYDYYFRTKEKYLRRTLNFDTIGKGSVSILSYKNQETTPFSTYTDTFTSNKSHTVYIALDLPVAEDFADIRLEIILTEPSPVIGGILSLTSLVLS
jgi:hypothetical protein